MSEARDEKAIAGFLDAQRFTRDQVFGEPCPVPSEPGVFGWWFRTLPSEIDVSGCEQRDGLTLLYVGISPTPPPASGKPPVSEDLRKRIRYHFGAGNASAEGSTLRKSLGVLLAKELGIELRRIGSGERSTFAGGEPVLTQWMAEHTLVSWMVRGEPWHFEGKLIAALDLPLNIQGNKRNAYYAELKRRRRDAAVNASKLRVLKEW
ncbi:MULTISPECIES: GIY-YIG nuclease family protein [unclassified Mycobacterium]|uniref:GIY-YIG nuclease family protein n=1 Tax=unclassified Mycobacterium TaxID=2642494 RepID=UPI0029C79F9C|nr:MULTISPECIES: hypothetical protein [unclassified Mycobacterium]